MPENKPALHDEQADEKQKPAEKGASRRKLPPIYTESLMEIFDFSERALDTNRSGFITRNQRQLIADDIKQDADAMWLLMMIMLGTAILVGLIMSFRGLPMIYLVIGAGILLLPMLLYAYTRQSKTRQDFDKTRVRSVQGQADVEWVGGGLSRRARLRVGDHTFDVSLHQGMALEEFDLSHLRVYFTEHSKTLLSAEVAHPNIDKLKMDDLQDEDDELLAQTGRQYDERET